MDLPSKTHPRRPLAVLVVDDYPDAATSLAELLNLMGHQAYCANSAEAALSMVELIWPDLVILDIAMPGVGGLNDG